MDATLILVPANVAIWYHKGFATARNSRATG
jgi:hypothetical protein